MVTQAESGRTVNVAKLKEWLTLASLIVVVVGGLMGGLRLVVSSAIAPLRADIQEINGRLDGIAGRLDRMDARMDRMDARMDRIETGIAALREDMNTDIAALREDTNTGIAALREDMNTDIAALREDTNEGFKTVGERLTRIETLLETLIGRDTDKPAPSDAPEQPSP